MASDDTTRRLKKNTIARGVNDLESTFIRFQDRHVRPLRHPSAFQRQAGKAHHLSNLA